MNISAAQDKVVKKKRPLPTQMKTPLRSLSNMGKKPSCGGCATNNTGEDASLHPDHSSQLVRLRRLRGQLSGIEKMISDRRYCVDILIQFRAVAAALISVEATILENHLKGCVQEVMQSKNEAESTQKISELVKLLSKRMR